MELERFLDALSVITHYDKDAFMLPQGKRVLIKGKTSQIEPNNMLTIHIRRLENKYKMYWTENEKAWVLDLDQKEDK